MYFANVSHKWAIRLTVIDPWEGSREWVIGQLWEYLTRPPDKTGKQPGEPEFFLFTPARIADFEGVNFYADGRCDKAECLDWVKTQYRKLQRCGIVRDNAKMAFSMLPVEEVF
jgi:hypothetical protein